MSAHAPKPFHACRLDAARFALEAGKLEGTVPLPDFPRLAQEAAAQAIAIDAPVVIGWQAQGEQRRGAGLDDGIARAALHLRAQARLPLVCQRCLQPVWTAIAVDRHFLFAPDEAQAMRLDEQAEDDVLAVAGDFDLLGLIEDELLLALPLAPRHDRCPQSAPQPAQNPGFDAGVPDKPHPFAALATLKGRQRGSNDL